MMVDEGVNKLEIPLAVIIDTSIVIPQAKIEPHHEVLEIGFGWGSMAIEPVRRTGCNYTGITLSKEQ